jgi:type IX secretion system PorP/SprF family membrane protein
MKKTLIFIGLLFSSIAFSQDYHFSQIDKMMPLINPAATSNFDGFEKFSAFHRSQWLGSGTKFYTTNALAELTLGKKRGREKAYLGLGIFFTNDIGGDSKMTSNGGGFSASGNVPLADGQWLSAGFQTAFNSRNADFSRLYYYNQFNGSGFDNTIPSGELNEFTSFGYVDAAAGISYRINKKRNRKYKSKNNGFQLGVSISHLNQPDLKYNVLIEDKLYRKLCIHTNFTIGLNSVSGLQFTAAQFFQGPHTETNFGIFYELRLKDISTLMSVSRERNLYIGSYFRIPNSFAPYIGIDFGDFSFGISYDKTAGLAGTAFKHSVEINLSYLITNKSLFKGR